jgi:hypothetical protein
MALGRVVELAESQTLRSQSVEIWGLDFGSVATQVRKAEIVGHNKNDVGSLDAARHGGQEEGKE